ncbi:hypothetical protein LINPERPRIM_LOCUS3834 [Linum perenne]
MMKKTGPVMHCSHCGQADHNMRGCKMTAEELDGLPKPPPPRPVGRPRRRPIQDQRLEEDTDQSGAGVRLEEVEIHADLLNQSQQLRTQPPNTQPRSSG